MDPEMQKETMDCLLLVVDELERLERYVLPLEDGTRFVYLTDKIKKLKNSVVEYPDG